jgi:hypothetical protein
LMKTLDINTIIDKLYQLKKTVTSDDPSVIRTDMDALEEATKPLAQEILNLSVTTALSGKEVENV